MNIRTLVILILLCPVLNNCNRQTKYFKNIAVQGRLQNYFTKAPIANKIVRLRSNDVHSASSYAEAAILLAEATTDADGHFELNSKASKKDGYYLQIDQDEHYSGGFNNSDTSFNAGPGFVDVGVLFSGEHTFFYKIKYVSVSGKCLYNNKPELFKPGKDTSVLYTLTQSYVRMRENRSQFYFSYKTGNCNYPRDAVPATTLFPISYADTMLFRVEY